MNFVRIWGVAYIPLFLMCSPPLFLVFHSLDVVSGTYMQRELLFMESCAYPDLPLSPLC
jgi:hypothetical protein